MIFRLCFVLLLMGACSPEKKPPSQKESPSDNKVLGKNIEKEMEKEVEKTQPSSVEIPPIGIVAITKEERKTQELANIRFSIDLYKKLAKKSNHVFSPISVSTALAMTYLGAGGKTEEQMQKTLHFDLEGSKLHSYFNALSFETKKKKSFTLNTANSLWFNKGLHLRKPFVETLSELYQSELNRVDFSNPESARKRINAWVGEKTAHKIEELLPSGALSPATRLVLVNSIYFKAKWRYLFNKTKKRFHNLDGKSKSHTFLTHEARYKTAVLDKVRIVEIDYKGREVSMVILFPKKIEELEQTIDAAFIQSALKGLRSRKMILSLPKFKLNSTLHLREILTSLGMKNAFTNAANFRKISNQDIQISSIIQKAFIAIDNKGTEATAATAVKMGIKTGALHSPPPPFRVTINRPFIYLIREKKTNSILFMGRLTQL